MKIKLNFKLLSLAVGVILLASCKGSPSVEWEKNISWETIQNPIDIKQTDDGGYIVLNKYLDLLKLDSIGNTLWVKQVLRGTSNFGNSIELSGDGGYMLLGYHYSVKTKESHFWVAKLDKEANVIWSKEYDSGANYDGIMAIENTDQGNYIIAGHRNHYVRDSLDISDYWISKIDSEGELIWTKVLGGSEDDIPYIMRKTENENYIVEGITYSNDGDVQGENQSSLPYSIWSVELNDNGDIVNSQQKSSFRINSRTTFTDEGEYLFANQEWVGDLDGSVDLVLEKRNSNLNLVWSKTITSPGKDESIKLSPTNNNGYILLARGPYEQKIIKLGY